MEMGKEQKEEIRSGRNEGKTFENEGGVGVLHWQKTPDGPG